MTLKDYINKEQLTADEEKQLIEELCNNPKNFMIDSSIHEVPTGIKKIIEECGLKNGNVAFEIKEQYAFIDVEGEIDDDCQEKENYWFLKAAELNCDSLDLNEIWMEDDNGEKDISSFYLDYYTPLVKKAEADCLNSWGCRYALGLDEEDINYKYARKFFEISKNDDSRISLYYIYANGLGVKKNLKKANSFIKNLPANTPLYAFKSNVSEGIKIEKIEEDNNQEQPKKEKKQRKPRKKNKVKSFFKKILSLFK